MVHGPMQRYIPTLGSVMKTGGSLMLAKGQIGVFNTDPKKTTPRGLPAVTSFQGLPPNTLFEIRAGRNNLPVTRSQSNKKWSTFPFAIGDVQDVQVSVPKFTEPRVDEVIVGYNGIDDNTALKWQVGERHKLTIKLSGEPIGMLGLPGDVYTTSVYMDADACSPYGADCVDCDPCGEVPCLPIVLRAIKELKEQWVVGGITMDDLIDITPIRKCDTPVELQETSYFFWCLELCDTGDETALARVQAQYPGYRVDCTGREGAITKYQIFAKEGETFADYQPTGVSVIKGCADCPTGYTEIEGGEVYAVTLEDDGVDQSAIVETMANAVVGTAEHQSQNKGCGMYTVVLSTKLSDANFEAFMAVNPTATIYHVGKTDAICDPAALPAIPWVQCGECKAIEQCYVITLPDNECGEDRLAELQEAYPDRVITMTGEAGGCQRQYKTTSPSNIRCEECDPIYLDTYTTEAPSTYDAVQWTFEDVSPEPSGNCLCAIRLKSRPTEVLPDECMRDVIGAVDSSILIEVSGGYLTSVRLGEENIDKPFHVQYLSRFEPRTHMGFNLWQFEDRGQGYFEGTYTARSEDRATRFFKGQESFIESGKQYVDYCLTIKRNARHTQSYGDKKVDDYATFHIYVEVGNHQDVESMVNMIGTAAGLPPVYAFATA